jgi:hypothetical protein
MAKDRKPLSLPDRFKILARDNFRCVYCGATAQASQLHIDHVVPRSKGGEDDPSNYVVACVACNLGKSDAILSEIMGRTEYSNSEWKCTPEGLEMPRNGYWIGRERLNEIAAYIAPWCSDWMMHLASKSNCYDFDLFIDAFYQAFLISGTPMRFDWHRSVERAREKIERSNRYDEEYQRRILVKYGGNRPLITPHDFDLMADWRY